MILTLTMNPSVDMSYHLDKLTINKVNRIASASKTAGGKGLNVARVLHFLGADISTTGLIGGRLGEFIVDQLNNSGIHNQFFKIKGDTRNCIALLHEGNQTEINEGGPIISEDESRKFLEYIQKISKDFDIITISGSLPRGLNTDYYSKLIELLDSKILLDTSGQALKETLLSSSKPFFIKPNDDELSDLLNITINKDINELKKVLNNDLFKGIEWIMVSLGADGALVKHGNKFYKADIPSVEVVNPVGSGDSTVAGFAYGLNKNLSTEDIIKTSMTCGILNALEPKTGYINVDNFDNIFNQVNIREI